jgi:hypothetical protein
VIKLNIFGITWKQVFDNLTREALKFVSILVFRIGHKGGGELGKKNQVLLW